MYILVDVYIHVCKWVHYRQACMLFKLSGVYMELELTLLIKKQMMYIFWCVCM